MGIVNDSLVKAKKLQKDFLFSLPATLKSQKTGDIIGKNLAGG